MFKPTSLIRLSASFVIALVFTHSNPIFAAGLDTWFIRETGFNLEDVIYANNRYVAVGLGKTIMTSANGATWQPASMKYGIDSFLGVTYGNSRFIAVGSQNVGSSVIGQIYSSIDGMAWTAENSDSNNILRDVVYNGSLFVAVGDAGTIVTSTDGSQWTLRNSNTTTHLYGVAFGNNQFVAVGNSGIMLNSADGVDWTSVVPVTTYPLNAVKFLNGLFVAVGNGGQLATSGNGSDWTLRQTNTSYALYTVTYGNGLYLAAGQMGTIISSTNGVQWNAPIQQDNVVFSAIIYAQNAYLAVGDRGTLLSSGNGSDWTYLFPDDHYLSDAVYIVRYINNRFYAGGGRYTFMHSDDGLSWTLVDPVTIGDFRVRGIAFGNNTYVAVAAYTTSAFSRTFTSSNGVDWTAHNPGLSDSMRALAFANGIFVAVGNNTAYTSTNGINWNTPTTTNIGSAVGLAYGNNLFVAIGWSGSIATSPDGDQWTSRDSGTNVLLNDIQFINGQFLVTGSTGTLLSSSNGVDWTPIDVGTTQNLYGISQLNSNYIIGTSAGGLISSNGAQFTLRDTHTSVDLNAVAFGNDTIVVGTAESTILQSDTIVAANEPDISLSSSTFDFGAVTIGTSSANQDLTVTNMGTQDLVIGNANITGTDSPMFSIENDLCSTATVLPSTNCQLSLVFSPTSAGSKVAILNIPSNDPDRANATVSLQGTGSAVPQPDIQISDSVPPAGDLLITFASIGLGSLAEQEFTISNVGDASLNVGAIQLSGVDAGDFNLVVNDGVSGRCSDLAPSLAGNTNCSIKLTFVPTVSGDKSGLITISSNDPDESIVEINIIGHAGVATEKPASGGGDGGGCFIATAAYGSYLHEDVIVLRQFRDEVLLPNAAGRKFVDLYYTYSPPLAEWIAESSSLRAITRVLLTPLVYAFKYPVIAVLLFTLSLFGVNAYRRRKRQLAM